MRAGTPCRPVSRQKLSNSTCGKPPRRNRAHQADYRLRLAIWIAADPATAVPTKPATCAD